MPLLPGFFSADRIAPAVSLTAPAAGGVTGTISVTATATDNDQVAGVQFYLDGVPLGAEDTVAPYSVSWNTATATPGSHSLTAVARDRVGNTTTTAAVAVTVADQAAPTIAFTSPAAGNVSDTITLTATASDNVGVVGVQFKVDGVNIGAEDTVAPYSMTYDTHLLTVGSHTFTAVARDAAGNTATATVVVNVTNAVPAGGLIWGPYDFQGGSGVALVNYPGVTWAGPGVAIPASVSSTYYARTLRVTVDTFQKEVDSGQTAYLNIDFGAGEVNVIANGSNQQTGFDTGYAFGIDYGGGGSMRIYKSGGADQSIVVLGIRVYASYAVRGGYAS
jgi:hypothetical protein